MVEGWDAGDYHGAEHHSLGNYFPVHNIPCTDTCQISFRGIFEMGMERHGQETSVEWLKEERRVRSAIPSPTIL